MNTSHSETDLGRTIVHGVVESEAARNMTIELGELALDRLLDEGQWRDVPALGTVVGILKTAGNVRDALFFRKVAEFFKACPKFSQEEKEAFMREHAQDREKAKRLGDTLVLLLERHDDLDKPELLAKVFAAYVREQISYDAFRRLASGIDASNIQDLKALLGRPVVAEWFAERYPLGLVRSGFATFVIKGVQYEGTGDQEAKISDLGRLFQKCVKESKK